MRVAGLAVVSALVLAACNPSGPGQSAGAGGVFPNLTTASYRIEATVTHDAGAMPVVMIRDGATRQRVEIATPAGPTTMITNSETGESFVLTNAGGQMMAMRMDADQFDDPAKDWSAEVASTARRTGDCAVAGENGAVWTRDDNGTPNTVCVTSDGIILRVTEGDRTVWETTSIQRGPQSAELFVLPPGVQVMDLGDVGSAMQDMLERAQSQAGQ